MTWEQAAEKGRSRTRLTKNEDGTYRFEIVLERMRLTRVAGNVYWMADMDSFVPVVVDFDGVRIRPRLVLKIFRKLNPHQIKYRDLNRKFPLLLSESPKIV